VHRDGAGGPDRLAFTRPPFAESWQNQVALGAAGTTHALLEAGRTPENAVALGGKAMAAVSTIADGLLAQVAARPPACAPGCAHCCHQPVGVSPPEVLAILDHLRRTRTPDALATVTGRVREADDRTRGLDPAARISPEHPCPFLDDGRCSIYEARPLACRGTNSLDATLCERALHDPETHAAYVAGDSALPCYLEPIRAFHAVAAGLQLAAHELHGLTMLPLDLTAAMRTLLDDPDGVAARWLAGEDPFAAARGADVTRDPRSRQLAGTI
jgi:hypothetical protein